MRRPISVELFEALKQENVSLREQLSVAFGQVAALTLEVGRLSELVAKGNERITELLAVAQRKSRSRGDKPAQKPAPNAPKSLSAEVQSAFENRPKAPERPKKPEKEKKKQRPTGRQPLPKHLPADERTLRPDACGKCGSTELETVDEVVETKLDAIKEHQRRRVVRRKTCRCKKCGDNTTARSLPSPFPRSKVTCEWLAWLVHQAFGMLVPLDRLRRDLAERGLNLSMGFLVSQIERAADLLGPIDGEHWKRLLSASWMATDATGLKVLIPGLPGSHSGHLEIFRNTEQVVFQYEPTKDSDVLVQKLASFAGFLVADAEHRHNAVFESGKITESGCNAHGRRKFRDAEIAQPVLAQEGGDYIAALYVAENEAQRAGLVGEQLKEWRQAKMLPIKAGLSRWIDAVQPTLEPDDALAKVLRYYRNHWDALFRFIDHPELPIDNSATEREYQNVAKLRLNRLFAGSTEGAHRLATLLGIIATCRTVGVDPLGYLAWAFVRLGTDRDLYDLTAAQLTPAAFAKSSAGP